MDNASNSPNSAYFWTSESYNESETVHPTSNISEGITDLNLSLQQIACEKPIISQQSQEEPLPSFYCNMAAMMPNIVGPSSLPASATSEQGETADMEEALNKRSRASTLAQLLMDELEDVSDEIFFETKWKIIDILREAQKKQRALRMEDLMRDRQRSRSSSPSIITLPSPSSTSPLLSEWGYEEQH